jgi:hypothetical protein
VSTKVISDAEDPISSRPVPRSNPKHDFERDANDNITKIIKTIGNEVYHRSFTYDAQGNITHIGEWVKQ